MATERNDIETLLAPRGSGGKPKFPENRNVKDGISSLHIGFVLAGAAFLVLIGFVLYGPVDSPSQSKPQPTVVDHMNYGNGRMVTVRYTDGHEYVVVEGRGTGITHSASCTAEHK